jgi:hypothetical protein
VKFKELEAKILHYYTTCNIVINIFPTPR